MKFNSNRQLTLAATGNQTEKIRININQILCNGPGICVPIAFVGLILKYLFLMDVTIVYVESVCRVKTLSLSAQLLYPFIDHLLVQWPQLKERYSGADFLGQLI
ncbi:UDP-N-acetylglucosamine transferase subunit ALG14 homolog [Octopus sinensis]|uniref:UDP-N-acetylglucosamine transferase subunit ALG14 n=1 Tax=Octopus sinensis TaxID=2607531 RepID=A0A7E6F200_9MOLL|nr:UDP-N-acetylglucosamine transferase subunit ALG14 homolog [Octopus sinensis]